MTLYGYYRSKEELLEAVVDLAVAGTRAPPRRGPWQEQLAELMTYARRAVDQHPALTRLRATRPVLRPEALRFAEAALEILDSAGFTRDDAALSFRLLFTYVFGYATFSPERGVAEARAEAATAIRALPAGGYPHLTSAGREVARTMAGDDAFEFGLARIISGLEAWLEADG
jgi:AcrR family transcriptional regulator